MKKEKSIIWISQVFILFSIARNNHAFFCPFPRSSVKPNKLEDFFPCLSLCKPRAFQDKSYLASWNNPMMYYVFLLLQIVKLISIG